MNYSLHLIKACIILDTDGHRILSKYYNPERYPQAIFSPREQITFEKGLWENTKKPKLGGDAILYGSHLTVYKHSLDLILYFVASPAENEIMLSQALDSFLDALLLLLTSPLEKRGLLKNLDLLILCLDETVDEGILLDTDVVAISSRVSKARHDVNDIVINEQAIISAYQTVKEKVHQSIRLF